MTQELHISVSDLSLGYKKGLGAKGFPAVSGVNFTLNKGETLAILGESGAGKSTLLACLAGSFKQQDVTLRILGGAVEIAGYNLAKLSGKAGETYGRNIGVLSQISGATLNPKIKVGDMLMQRVKQITNHPDAEYYGKFVSEMLHILNLSAEHLQKLPHELSKGQRQRIALMETLMLEPEVLILDEPTNGVDVLHKPGIVELLKWYRARKEVTIVTVCHEISILEAIVDKVLVMQLGQPVGYGNINDIFQDNPHPYVANLANALRQAAYDEASEKKINN